MNQIEIAILNCSAIKEAEKTWYLLPDLHREDIPSTIWKIFFNYTISLIELIL